MKKIALLMTLVLVFSLSCVFATEADATLLSAPIVSGELVNDTEVVTTTESISGEDDVTSDTVEAISGELEETVSGDVENNETVVEDDEEIASSSNSAMVGAILAIAIVIAVVAIVAILRKD